ETWIPPQVNNTGLWKIREVSLRDVEEVTKIFVNTYQGTIDEQLFVPGGLKMEEESIYLSNFLQNRNSEFPIINAASLVATLREDEIAGFCFISTWRDLPFVWEMVVSKKHQRKGIGKSLFVQSLLRVRDLGYKQIALFVTHGNDIARTLYDSIGFKADSCTQVMFKKD
ncbi:MAG: GNAT family N-acetyltransferase, partial [Candidatus Hodarchaeota archaeon]